MKIQFLGVGAAFTTAQYYQSNLLLTSERGKKLLLDAGGDIRFALSEAGVPASSLDGVYLSHQHADHIGGMEFLAYATFFDPSVPKLKLYVERELATEVWEHSLRGGLSVVDDQPRGLNDFFEVRLLDLKQSFVWEGWTFTLYKMPHVITKVGSIYSYGLLAERQGYPGFFFSSDSTFAPEILKAVAPKVQLIFHDCETRLPPTGVHCHYLELKTLPQSVKSKLWAYHYQPDPPYQPQADGMLGFVKKGQEFHFKKS
ncbi:MAG: hypothetical protein A2600_00690 [Candidatus Lambdaproteobacteria bacterium RIFOXYD1_FULL_56_27]|uniref:Uncharacterized protein n=1 Tax=Candidatus Lambdaproteobacteria bacterium RIFOXYD2_FULL_56_26 TaxID=1817773 RepID=A0A1F6GLR7_9PROT|nr:MAG: hypothetical protein A2557_09830 [Candidatus Lambdaproteobacteria bacterium RIFOXYD2_FULL_56_26]OGH01439.1 MAG: hypothetical protein A2426_08615 [Candidatus Lambdaproteobacteria bacterium RIFOXYC1_FULL_56_13]OGH07074.1 MAG: hypothetical protein A2600_00690 [Candidatus Lambdaproteobacteria bacterium RIFOXYD1_FULL_56_27]